MSNKLFSDEEINVLSKNKYVKSVSKRGIAYTDDFKTLFISEYNKWYLQTQIFIDAGFDGNILGNHRIYNASKRRRKSYREYGELGFRDIRKVNSGRPISCELSVEEIIAKKDAGIAYWKMRR